MKIRILKTVAVFVLVTFIATSVDPVAFGNPSVAGEVPLSLAKTLEIPAELGQVTDNLIGNSSAPAFIHIQSAHGNYEAEKNIEKLLGHIEKNSSVKLMFLEGAAEKLHPEIFRIFPNQPGFNRKVTDKLMQEGYLTGPETFLVESAKKMEGWGVEDLDSYKKDRDAFIDVVKKEKLAEKSLAFLRAEIDKRFGANLSKELLTLVRQEEAFGSGAVSFEGWLKILGEASKKHLQMDLSDAFYQAQYPFLIRYYRLQTIGSRIDREKAMKEADSFIKDLERRKISKEIIDLFKQNGVRRTQDAVQASSYSPLRRAFDLAFDKLPKDFSMTKWPSWTLYAQHVILMQELEAKGLQEETVKLKSRIFETLAKTPAEKEYLAEARELFLLKRLFSLELTRNEYEELAQGQSKNTMQGLYDPAMEFYKVAVDREQHMFANALKKMGAEKQSRAVIVTGGFHADGLKKLAASKGCSYIQITPRISEVSKRDHEVYLNSMLGSRDVDASQIAVLLGLVDRAQRVTVTGIDLTKAWLRDIRTRLLRFIDSEDVPSRSGLEIALANSIFGSLTPAMARAEVRRSNPLAPTPDMVRETLAAGRNLTDTQVAIKGIATAVANDLFNQGPGMAGRLSTIYNPTSGTVSQIVTKHLKAKGQTPAVLAGFNIVMVLKRDGSKIIASDLKDADAKLEEAGLAVSNLSKIEFVRRSEMRLTDVQVSDIKTVFGYLAERAQNIPQNPDVLIVLGNPNHELTAEGAVEAYKKYSPKHILVSGKGTGSRAEAEIIRDLMIKKGVTASIDIETESENTGENARFSADFLKAKELKLENAVLVQMPTGMLLSRLIFEKQFPWEDAITFYSFAPSLPEVTENTNPETIAFWLQHALGQIDRLNPDNPQGAVQKGFIKPASVSLPQDVLAAAFRLRAEVRTRNGFRPEVLARNWSNFMGQVGLIRTFGGTPRLVMQVLKKAAQMEGAREFNQELLSSPDMDLRNAGLVIEQLLKPKPIGFALPWTNMAGMGVWAWVTFNQDEFYDEIDALLLKDQKPVGKATVAQASAVSSLAASTVWHSVPLKTLIGTLRHSKGVPQDDGLILEGEDEDEVRAELRGIARAVSIALVMLAPNVQNPALVARLLVAGLQVGAVVTVAGVFVGCEGGGSDSGVSQEGVVTKYDLIGLGDGTAHFNDNYQGPYIYRYSDGPSGGDYQYWADDINSGEETWDSVVRYFQMIGEVRYLANQYGYPISTSGDLSFWVEMVLAHGGDTSVLTGTWESEGYHRRTELRSDLLTKNAAAERAEGRVPTELEVDKGRRYEAGELKTTPMGSNWVPASSEDISDVASISPEERKELMDLGARHLSEGIFQRIWAGASSRQSPQEQAQYVRLVTGDRVVQPFDSKSMTPIALLPNGDPVTYGELDNLDLERFLAEVERQALGAGVDARLVNNPALLTLSSDAFRSEHDRLFSQNENFGFRPEQLSFYHQPAGPVYYARTQAVERLYNNKDIDDARFQKALPLSQQAERDYQAGHYDRLIIPGEGQSQGHGELGHLLIENGLLVKLWDGGKKWFYVKNVENAFAKYDDTFLVLLGYFLKNKLDMLGEAARNFKGHKGGKWYKDKLTGNLAVYEDPNAKAAGVDLSLPSHVNNAVAFFSMHYLISLYAKEGQSDGDFIEELRQADQAKRVAMADAGRQKFPLVLDEKKSVKTDAIYAKLETNWWTGMAIALASGRNIKVGALGVGGPLDFPIDAFDTMSAAQRHHALAYDRFGASKQWDLTPKKWAELKEAVKVALGKEPTPERLAIMSESYKGTLPLYQALAQYQLVDPVFSGNIFPRSELRGFKILAKITGVILGTFALVKYAGIMTDSGFVQFIVLITAPWGISFSWRKIRTLLSWTSDHHTSVVKFFKTGWGGAFLAGSIAGALIAGFIMLGNADFPELETGMTLGLLTLVMSAKGFLVVTPVSWIIRKILWTIRKILDERREAEVRRMEKSEADFRAWQNKEAGFDVELKRKKKASLCGSELNYDWNIHRLLRDHFLKNQILFENATSVQVVLVTDASNEASPKMEIVLPLEDIVDKATQWIDLQATRSGGTIDFGPSTTATLLPVLASPGELPQKDSNPEVRAEVRSVALLTDQARDRFADNSRYIWRAAKSNTSREDFVDRDDGLNLMNQRILRTPDGEKDFRILVQVEENNTPVRSFVVQPAEDLDREAVANVVYGQNGELDLRFKIIPAADLAEEDVIRLEVGKNVADFLAYVQDPGFYNSALDILKQSPAAVATPEVYRQVLGFAEQGNETAVRALWRLIHANSDLTRNDDDFDRLTGLLDKPMSWVFRNEAMNALQRAVIEDYHRATPVVYQRIAEKIKPEETSLLKDLALLRPVKADEVLAGEVDSAMMDIAYDVPENFIEQQFMPQIQVLMSMLKGLKDPVVPQFSRPLRHKLAFAISRLKGQNVQGQTLPSLKMPENWDTMTDAVKVEQIHQAMVDLTRALENLPRTELRRLKEVRPSSPADSRKINQVVDKLFTSRDLKTVLEDYLAKFGKVQIAKASPVKLPAQDREEEKALETARNTLALKMVGVASSESLQALNRKDDGFNLLNFVVRRLIEKVQNPFADGGAEVHEIVVRMQHELSLITIAAGRLHEIRRDLAQWVDRNYLAQHGLEIQGEGLSVRFTPAAADELEILPMGESASGLPVVQKTAEATRVIKGFPGLFPGRPEISQDNFWIDYYTTLAAASRAELRTSMAQTQVLDIPYVDLTLPEDISLADLIGRLGVSVRGMAKTAKAVTGGLYARVVVAATKAVNALLALVMPTRSAGTLSETLAAESIKKAQMLLGLRQETLTASDVFVLGRDLFLHDHRAAVGIRQAYSQTTITAIVRTPAERALLDELNLRLAKESLLPILPVGEDNPAELAAHLNQVRTAHGTVRPMALLYGAETIPVALKQQLPNQMTITQRMLKGFLAAMDALVAKLVNDLATRFATARSA